MRKHDLQAADLQRITASEHQHREEKRLMGPTDDKETVIAEKPENQKVVKKSKKQSFRKHSHFLLVSPLGIEPRTL